jgi:alkylated DNA repair dioxygenase AlkB
MFDLFSNNQISNLLPYDGTAIYHGMIIPIEEANRYFNELYNNICWRHDDMILFGKHIVTNRKVALYADKPLSYNYSNTTKKALPWVYPLLEIKSIVEQKTGALYNACLLNLYHNGSEAMGWHSDDENELHEGASIASLSFGAERNFSFKHKKSQAHISLILENGSLLEMKEEIQKHWVHRLPLNKVIKRPRINLTFRCFSD